MSDLSVVKWALGGAAAVGLAAIVFFANQAMQTNRELGSLGAKLDANTARLDRMEDKLDRLLANSDNAATQLDNLQKSLAALDGADDSAIAASLRGWKESTNPAALTGFAKYNIAFFSKGHTSI